MKKNEILIFLVFYLFSSLLWEPDTCPSKIALYYSAILIKFYGYVCMINRPISSLSMNRLVYESKIKLYTAPARFCTKFMGLEVMIFTDLCQRLELARRLVAWEKLSCTGTDT